MSNYYYLVAQLPAVVFSSDSKATLPISFDYFKDLCARFLDGDVLEQINSLSLEPPKEPADTGFCFLNKWYSWERSLRLALAQQRATKMQKNFDCPEAATVTQDIQQLARTACAFDSPLEAEQFLNKERLKMIDDFSSIDAFCADAVLAYGVKLLLASRIQKFDENAGMESYRIIYDQILGESK